VELPEFDSDQSSISIRRRVARPQLNGAGEFADGLFLFAEFAVNPAERGMAFGVVGEKL
jgi:hypothetical protein